MGGPRVSPETQQQVVELLGQGLTKREIAGRTGTSYAYVQAQARLLPGWQPGPKGHANPLSHPWRKHR